MGLLRLQSLCLVVKVYVFASFLLLQGSAVSSISSYSSAAPALPPSGEETTGHVSSGKALGSAPAPAFQPNGTFSLSPLASPPLKSASGPQMNRGSAPPLVSNAPAFVPPYSLAPPPVASPGIAPEKPPSDNPYKRRQHPQHPEHPVIGSEAPVPIAVPSKQPSSGFPMPEFMPPGPHHDNAPRTVPSVPVMNAPAPRTTPHTPSNPHFVKPVEPPSIVLEPDAPAPSKLQETLPPAQSTLPNDPPSSLPGEHNTPPQSTRHPGINRKRTAKPVAALLNRTGNHHPPVSSSPINAPSRHKSAGNFNSAPPPLPYPKSAPNTGLHSPACLPSTTEPRCHHRGDKITSPAPQYKAIPPHASTKQAKGHPISNLWHHALPPSKKVRHPSPSGTPSQSSPWEPEMPFRSLPPPPPNEDCDSLTCSEPLTNGLPGPLCICVLPIKVGLRLSVALYTFFPLVPEFAVEISAGVFMKQSQVRIMGANEATQDPEKTIVLIDLVPLGDKFDNTTAYLTFQRFWHKQVEINTSLFGNYEVLYLRYPGLPPSPPSASSDIDVIVGDSYHNHDNNARTMKPLGVDVSRKEHKKGPNTSVIAIIILSASVAVILCCAMAWVLLLKNRDSVSPPSRTPPIKFPSLAKSSGAAASIVGSGPSSASLSLGSSIAAYTGSAKTFSSSDIGRATCNFNETRILGEGGFGRVYSGVLDDGTNVAVKVLKRDDHQGGREFLAEVEMLSRLHHRNLVKLIGICTEERARCLVYELVPNGSVESHLHGTDKDTASLDWAARLKIALGAARGLAYLHEDSSPRVIHRDFKASNILLEDDFTPKVSDFGLARAALDEENRHISTRVMGTFGYVAPEYAMTGHLLVKSDVYSYGVVLLELLTGRKPVDMSQPPGEENLVSWARPLLTNEEGLALMVDPSLGPDIPFDSITKVAAIASMCVQPEVSNRPFMGEVVQALKLVCNECEETKELGSRRSSREDISIDIDARISTNSEHLPDPVCTPSPVCHYGCELDAERRLSMSELISSSARYEISEYESERRHSSSGPLRTRNTRQMWQKLRRFSGGSMSEHGLMYRLWPRSN